VFDFQSLINLLIGRSTFFAAVAADIIFLYSSPNALPDTIATNNVTSDPFQEQLLVVA
jgi:hypothetical protein